MKKKICSTTSKSRHNIDKKNMFVFFLYNYITTTKNRGDQKNNNPSDKFI